MAYDGSKGVDGNGLSHILGKMWSKITSMFQTKVTGGATSILDTNLTKNRALQSDSSGKVSASEVSSTELGYLKGVNQKLTDWIGGKANQSDFQDLANAVNTEFRTNIPNTYQKKIKVGTANSGAVTVVTAGSNVNIAISADGKTATISSTDTKYTLPAASTTLGGVKLEKETSARGIQIDAATGIIGVSCGYSIGYDDSDGLLDVALYPEGGLAIMEPSQGKFGLAVVCGSSTYLDEGHIEVVQADDNRKGIVYLFNTDSEVTNSSMAGLGAPSYSLFLEKLAGKANLASPTFSGTPKAPTAAKGTNTTQLATTAYVVAAVSDLATAVDAIGNQIAAIEGKERRPLGAGESLPSVGDKGVIYMVPKTVDGRTYYEEWYWVNLGTTQNPSWGWEKMGDSDIQLAGYVKKTDFLTNSELDEIFAGVFGSAA